MIFSIAIAQSSFMKKLSVLFLVFLLSGCSGVTEMTSDFFGGKDNTEPPAPLTTFTPQVSISQLWSVDIGSGSAKYYLKLSPAINYGMIYSASADGNVVALDAKTGAAKWNANIKLPISGGPGTGDGLVYVGSSEAYVVALDAQTGSERWRVRVPSEVLTAPVSAEGVVVVRTIDGRLTGLSSTDGKQVWQRTHPVPVLSLRGSSEPVLFRGAAFIGFSDGKLSAILLKDGRLLWSSRVALPRGRTELERMVDIDSEPLVDDFVVHAVSYQGNIATMETRSGKVLWRRDISSHAGISNDQNNLYVTDDKSHIWSLDRRTGSSFWMQDKLHARQVTAPVSHGKYIVVADVEGYVHWLNKENGSLAARTRLGDKAVIARPQVVDDIAYILAKDGRLNAYVLAP
jgi:outer membrane protein assembly factor BamB